jgi:DNA-binding NarL/FixJ family response regulator
MASTNNTTTIVTNTAMSEGDYDPCSTPKWACWFSPKHLESRYAMRLIEEHPGGTGYLLKQRVSNLGVLTDALMRLRDDECVIDPTIVACLVKRARPARQLAVLTDREREVLALMAEGRSNKAICAQLFLSPKTVEAHVKHIFMKLGINESPDDHRRVRAVVAYLRS